MVRMIHEGVMRHHVTELYMLLHPTCNG